MKLLCTHVTFILALICSTLTGFGQITISQENILNTIGTTMGFETDGRTEINVMPGDSGANQTWDFREIAIVDTIFSITDYLAPGNTPYDANFPNTNLVTRVTSPTETEFVQYGYNEITPSEYIVLGSVSEITGQFDTTLTSVLLDTTRVLPLTFGDSWESVTADTLVLSDLFSTITFDTTFSQVDAWGTVRLPAGDFECLRLRETSRTTSGQLVSGVFIPNSFQTFVNYTWIAQGGYSVAFMQSLDGDANPNFTMASSFGRLASIGGAPTPVDKSLAFVEGFSVSPNPITHTAQFTYRLLQPTSVKLTVYDLTGRKMTELQQATQPAGKHTHSWTPHLSQGIYLGVLEGEGWTQTLKLIYHPQ